MMNSCDAIAERIALGEPLGEHAAHVTTCARCQRVVEMTAQLGATRHAVDPGLGFTARMTVGAQHRITVRRRRRIGAGLAATALAGALAVFVITRPATAPVSTVATDTSPAPSPAPPIVEPSTEDDLEALLDLADTDRSSRLTADWAHITKPLSPYRRLLTLPPAPGVSP